MRIPYTSTYISSSLIDKTRRRCQSIDQSPWMEITESSKTTGRATWRRWAPSSFSSRSALARPSVGRGMPTSCTCAAAASRLQCLGENGDGRRRSRHHGRQRESRMTIARRPCGPTTSCSRSNTAVSLPARADTAECVLAEEVRLGDDAPARAAFDCALADFADVEEATRQFRCLPERHMV